jgi:hypothetical protein
MTERFNCNRERARPTPKHFANMKMKWPGFFLIVMVAAARLPDLLRLDVHGHHVHECH